MPGLHRRLWRIEMKKKSVKPLILSQLLGIDQIASIHSQVMEWLRHKNHIEISFGEVDGVDVSFLQWFIAFVRTAKLKPYTVVISGPVPAALLRSWEFIGFSTPFYEFLKENQVSLREEE